MQRWNLLITLHLLYVLFTPDRKYVAWLEKRDIFQYGMTKYWMGRNEETPSAQGKADTTALMQCFSLFAAVSKN